MLLGGQGNYCASGRRERRSRLSTTSPNVSSKVKSYDPCLLFNSRQREGEFFKQGCGDKGTTSLSSCSGPCGTNVSLSLFQAQMLNDPKFAKNVKGLEGMLRVRERLGESSRVFVPAPGSAVHNARQDAGYVAPGSASVGISAASAIAGESKEIIELLQVCETDFPEKVGTSAASAIAGESKEIIELLEVCETDFPEKVGTSAAAATAGERKGINGLLEVIESEFSAKSGAAAVAETVGSETADQARVLHGTSSLFLNSRIHPHGHRSRIHGSHSSHARARAVAVAALPAGAASRSATSVVATPARFSCSFPAVVADAASACATSVHDSAFNSGSAGGLLPVCKSTSYNLEVCSQGPTWRKGTKGGVSGPAEDLRPVSEVEAGVNFRPAGGARGQVAGSLPGKQPGTGTRHVKGSVVTPSLHPEVPGIQFVSPGYGLDIRQSMGWTKVCGTTRSGIWVLKGNARTCMFPANLDHLRVEWMKRCTYETAWVTPGHDCLCSYKYGHGAAVRPQTNNAIWDGVIGLWSRVAPFLSPWSGKKDVPTGVNLNQYAGSGSFIRWLSDNELLFGPQNLPKLIVSLSLGNSVEYMVRRRASRNVPSSIRLDHGDVLVMDGLAQSEYEHCTASELQGPRVNFTYRWVAQHTASCPLAGVVGCVLPTCAQGLVEPSSRWLGEGENKWSSSW